MQKVVLVVEDDFFIRDLYKMSLESKGLKVLTASDGEEAIEVFNREQPDVVLLDIMLPEMSGMDVLKYIREQASQGNQTPVIMATNLETTESMNRAMQLGATDYWVKSTKDPMSIAEGINHYVLP